MHTVIIGNGISGITAARTLRKISNNTITVISAETDYFFSRTALMYIYMRHMNFEHTQPYEKWFWEKNRIELLRAYVNEIDFEKQILHIDSSLKFDSDHPAAPTSLRYDQLILALGSESNKFGWPGQDLKGVRGLYSKPDLDYIESYDKNIKRAVIVGGGLIGIELAEMLHSRHIPVTMLVREETYWNNVLPKEESQMIGQHILAHGIDLRLSAELKEIISDENGYCQAVILKDGETIDCEFVGLTAGVHPNVHWLKASALEINRGIVVNDLLETNQQNVYAIGDCAELKTPKPGRRPIEAIWYTGRMMGETVAHNIMGKTIMYNPGIWFNSAKFMDIEYQVYGDVPSTLPENTQTVFWQNETEAKSIRINFDKKIKNVTGFNVMGIRLRHEVCEKWIAEKTNIVEVLANLNSANFDPEFTLKEYAKQITLQYNN